jgi:alkyl sulfatase BDS1-like metallo-beta-lactamase superfamily hydrolase
MSQSRLEGLAQQFSSGAIASKPASPHTAAYNARFASTLPLDDPRDFEDATRGLLEQEDRLVIKNNAQPGVNAWTMNIYDFIKARGEQAPETVNPSLWRQARLNNIHGFFEVLPGKDVGIGGIYQCRGYDISWGAFVLADYCLPAHCADTPSLSNMTFIESASGVIVIDPAISVESAAAMLAVYRKHRGPRPVTAVIITHSHVDHFGGMQACLPAPDAEGRYSIPIIAPEGFMEHAVSENVLAGNAMVRRAMWVCAERGVLTIR